MILLGSKVISVLNWSNVNRSGLNIFKNVFCTALPERAEEPVPEARDVVQEHMGSCKDITLDAEVEKLLEAKVINHRRHPGARGKTPVQLPERLLKAAQRVIRKSDHPLKVISRDASKLQRQMNLRMLPATDREIRELTQKVANKIMLRDDIDSELLTEEVTKQLLANQQRTIQQRVQMQVYGWKPPEYDPYKCLLYLYGLFANNYAALFKIFEEIKKQAPDFKPTTLFDFGSGVGSTLWAAKETFRGSVVEAFCVDSSQDMNDLARLLLQDGKPEAEPWLKNIFFKPFSPPSNLIKYQLVVCAHSLMDCPTPRERIKIVNNLWNKTEDMLVIVEHGSYAGHSLVIEARDYILEQFNQDLDKKQAYVIAPCPHDLPCPKMKVRKKIPCSFPVLVHPMSFEKVRPPVLTRFSYTVLSKKNHQPKESPNWPRLISDVMKRPRHVICELCNPDGQLYRTTVSKYKSGRPIYRCVRSSHWGDLIPATLSPGKTPLRRDSVFIRPRKDSGPQHPASNSDSDTTSDLSSDPNSETDSRADSPSNVPSGNSTPGGEHEKSNKETLP